MTIQLRGPGRSSMVFGPLLVPPWVELDMLVCKIKVNWRMPRGISLSDEKPWRKQRPQTFLLCIAVSFLNIYIINLRTIIGITMILIWHYSVGHVLLVTPCNRALSQPPITNSDLNRPCFAWHPCGKSGSFKTELVIVTRRPSHSVESETYGIKTY